MFSVVAVVAVVAFGLCVGAFAVHAGRAMRSGEI